MTDQPSRGKNTTPNTFAIMGGRTGNASLLSTGIQDTWWVHLPAALAG